MQKAGIKEKINMAKAEMGKALRENRAFSLFVLTMALYYGWRMFALDPWYDELYTYYSFISRGPVYSAIHWPVPNNHVFYSVLSGCLMVFQNPYIALRGISWLFSVGNLILMYVLAGRFFSKGMAQSCVVLYSSFYLVNSLSIQGRGYTLSIGFFLLALIMLYQICVEEKKGFGCYLLFSLSLTAGLYTISSNVYWVLPVCLAGGLCLMLNKSFRVLLHLIAASIAAAVNTLILYSIIWLAIGSNLLSKTEGSEYFGIYQVNIILQAPFRAWKRGMDYMLASPYVQSMDRKTVVTGFFSWLTGLMNLFFSSWGLLLALLLAASLFLCIWMSHKAAKEKKKERFFLYLFFISVLWGLPVILMVQSVQPYYRVFTFLGVPLALLLIAYVDELVRGKQQRWILWFCLLIAVLLLPSSYYNASYADREIQIKEIWNQAGIDEEPKSIFYTDDYQRYVFKFYWDYEPLEVSLKEAEYILMPKEITDEGFTEYVWPILYNHEGIDWDYLNGCERVCETESYRLYKKVD